jgi:hypothetical protein
MESIFKYIAKDRFRNYRRLYSIKDLILEIREISEADACKMCFFYSVKKKTLDIGIVVKPRMIDFINRYGDNYTRSDLCSDCKKDKIMPYCLIELLSLIYIERRDRFEEIVKLLRVKLPYDLVLSNLIFKHCASYVKNDEPCPMIIELIGKIANIEDSSWISYHGDKYLDYFIEKCCKINLKCIVSVYLKGVSIRTLEKVISRCGDEEKIITLDTDLYPELEKKRKHLNRLGIKIIPRQ